MTRQRPDVHIGSLNSFRIALSNELDDSGGGWS